MGYLSFRHSVYICILSIIHQIKNNWNITSSQSITSPSDNGKTKCWSWQVDKPIHDPSTLTLPRKHIMHLLLSLALTDSVVFPNKNLHFSQKMPALGCIIMWYWLRLLGEPWPFIKSQHESLKGFALSYLCRQVYSTKLEQKNSDLRGFQICFHKSPPRNFVYLPPLEATFASLGKAWQSLPACQVGCEDVVAQLNASHAQTIVCCVLDKLISGNYKQPHDSKLLNP